ncbi:MAG: CsgG/HfaB family protein [Cyclobacteriaceae bacterium]
MKRSTSNLPTFKIWPVLLLFLLAECAPYFEQPVRTSSARLGAESNVGKLRMPLPPPKEKIVAAVYKFRDQTGQYKPVLNGNSFSTAVTQGATSILIRALEQSNWFTVIERENVGNLLNERKIIRSSRAEFGDKSKLSPLLFAGIILEGGIISYDANMLTGGAGLRYFGAGVSGQYREDRITIYLRAISTSNGRILKTVYTSKTILSQMVDIGLFRFVKFQKLLEAETGFTYNEPAEMAVKEAIEKAVESLVIEGIQDGLWQLQTEEQRLSPVLQRYDKEKQANQNVDVFDRFLKNRRSQIAFGFRAGGQLYAGDFTDAVVRPGAEIFFNYALNRAVSMSFNTAWNQLATKDFYDGTFGLASLRLEQRWFPKDRFTPYVFGGPGIITEGGGNDFSRQFLLYGVGGLGFEYLVKENLGLQLSFDYNYVFSDKLDREIQGKYNDYFWGGKIGVSYYFGEGLR